MKLLSQVIAGLAIHIRGGDGDLSVSDVADDSRLVQSGSLFIDRGASLPDDRRRANLDDAISKGAVAIISDMEAPGDLELGEVAWCVSDRLVDQGVAGRVAEAFFDHPSQQLALIGITGTNGKSTTAMIIQHLLHSVGVRCGLIGTIFVDDGENREPASLTTPGAVAFSRLLALMVENGCEAAVAEMSSHALEQGRGAALDLNVAVFTNLTGDHLDYHGNMNAYAAAKARLFEQIGPSGWAVVNSDDPYSERMLQDCRAHVLRTGVFHLRHAEGHTITGRRGASGAQLDCSATVLSLGVDHSHVRFDGPWGDFEVQMPLIGMHNVYNALEAVAAASAVAELSGQLRRTLRYCPPVPGRLEPVSSPTESDDQPRVFVDYAHTHDALENVLTALRQVMTTDLDLSPEASSTDVEQRRLICVFGCGGDRDRTKRSRMAEGACRFADRVYITNDNPRTEDPQQILADVMTGVPDRLKDDSERVTVELDRRKAIRAAILDATDRDIVVIAGKGHEDYQIVGTVKHPFDDREVAADALGERGRASTV